MEKFKNRLMSSYRNVERVGFQSYCCCYFIYRVSFVTKKYYFLFMYSVVQVKQKTFANDFF